MKFLPVLITLAASFFFVCTTQAVTFEWASIGNPGNPADPETGFGSVKYAYRISVHEVTNAQYTEFLNAVDTTGGNSFGLYSPHMSNDARGGINFNPAAGNGAKFEVKAGRDNNPVVYVSFFDAMRFVNWLQNGQGSDGTELGVYAIGNGTNELRDPKASYFIPSEDEWYKAAYHRNDGATDNYWDYPTSTDTEPYSDDPNSLNTPDDTNVANFFKSDNTFNGYDDGTAVTGLTEFDDSENYLTDVGAYTQAVSPYGTFDQAGNVFELNEAIINSTFRGSRGGSWGSFSFILAASFRGVDIPSGEFANVGFRIASIPEPSTACLGSLAGCGLLAWWKVTSKTMPFSPKANEGQGAQ